MALPPVLSWVDEFRAFIARGSVVDLAVGVIIGVAFGGIVTSLVKDILNPIIGVFLGGVDFTNIFIPLNGSITTRWNSRGRPERRPSTSVCSSMPSSSS